MSLDQKRSSTSTWRAASGSSSKPFFGRTDQPQRLTALAILMDETRILSSRCSYSPMSRAIGAK